MASNVFYVHELPFQPRDELCRIIDADRRWKELGGTYMKYDVITLDLIGDAILRKQSPTWELLNKYSEKNGTVRSLFKMLARMNYQRVMTILKPYVDSKYHVYLCDESTMSTSCFEFPKNNIPRPSLSQLSVTQSTLSSPGAIRSKADVKQPSLFQQNFVNLDKEFSKISLHSKMNSLSEHNSKAALKKRQPHFQKNGVVCQGESEFDNCSPEKMNQFKKNSKPDETAIFRQPKHSLKAVNGVEDSLCDFMRIPYEEILLATRNFESRVLGRGGFGTVYEGEWKGISVAIKKLTPRQNTGNPLQQSVSLKQTLNELNILKSCRFDHILPLYAISLDGENPCLIYQLMVNGSLEDRLLLKGNTAPLTWSQRSHISESTAKGLNFLHTYPGKPLVHGDIKSANILLDANMDAKIGDFGLTREGPGCEDTHVRVSSVHGTECYLPIEYLRQKLLSPQVDIYSYGIVLLEIATGLRAFDAKRGKGKRLADHVNVCAETGRLESLRDVKAGEEKMIWFQELVRIGQVCSSDEKKKRPPMNQILSQFEKIKLEMSMFDRIRRLSNEKENSSLPSNLTPIEIQLYYDFQKSGLSPPGNRPSLSPRGQTPTSNVVADKPLVGHIEERRSSDLSCIPSEVNDIEEGLYPNACENFLIGDAPIPNITLLKLQVMDNTGDNISSDILNSTVSQSTTSDE